MNNNNRTGIQDLSDTEGWLSLFNVIPDAVLITTYAEGRILKANPACEQVYLHQPATILDRTTVELGIFPSLEKRRSLLQSVEETEKFITEMVYTNGRGHRRYGLFSGQRIRYQKQECLILIGRDITEYKINKQALNESIRRFYLLAESTNDIPWQINTEGVIEYIGPAIQQLGYKSSHLLNHDLLDIIHPDDAALFKGRLAELQQNKLNTSHIQLRILSRNRAHSINFEVTTIAEYDTFHNIIAIHGLMHDISHHEEEKAMLEKLANRDELTGLYNRRYFFQHIASELLGRVHDDYAYFLLMDLDNFKPINDTYGHLKGDEVLRETASCLQHNLRSEDIIFRFGGDEFAAFVFCHHENDILTICDRILRSIASLDLGMELHTSASIGITRLMQQESESLLLEQADKAMYRAKQSGRNQCVLFQPN